jgi:hypothetical protein
MSRDRRRLVLVSGLSLAALAAAAAIALLGTVRGSSAQAPLTPPARLPGVLTGPPPWPRNVERLRDRLALLGLPALAAESTVLHTHQHLDLFVNGRQVVVPAGIGIGAAFISPLHTHDPDGIIHVESPTMRTSTLGQFFGVWGVRLTRHCLGGECARVRAFVDGAPVSGDPRRVPLDAHEEIVVAVGRPPQRIPRSYAFPPGF